METIQIEKLERTSKNWNQLTTSLAIFTGGSGNMFGGGGKSIVATLHGKNSITETGTVEVIGEIEYSYNIARGANGETMSHAIATIKGVKTEITVKGNCGADSALISLLGLTKDWIITE